MDNKEKSPEKELIESIGLMIEKGMESNTNIYTGVVKSVDGKRAVVTVNGQNQNVSIATANVSSGNVVRVFVPEGNMSAAFIIKAEASGGGGITTTAYGDLTGKPRINGVTLIDNKTSKELNLYGTGNEPPYPVTSVNGQTGDVTISAGGNVDSVNGKTGVVVLTQDDIGDGTTYVRTHNDFTDAFKTQINTNEDNIAMAESDIDGLQTIVGTLQTNVSNVQTALTSKQDVIVGAASTITENNLTANRALVSNSSGKVEVSNVTSTELGYLDGVTGNIQTQLNNKLEEIPVANSTTLGGVKPVAKTSDMTQNVGVDANGALYTAPDVFKVVVYANRSSQTGVISYIVNHKFAEIKSAVNSHIPVMLYFRTNFMSTVREYMLAGYNSLNVWFVSFQGGGVGYASMSMDRIDISSYDVVTVSSRGVELTSNKVTALSDASTNTEYPSAKTVWDTINGMRTLPAVTEEDDGAFLRVVNGGWEIAMVPDANGEGF